MLYELSYPNYSLQQSELRLAELECQAIGEVVKASQAGLTIETSAKPQVLERLAFFHAFRATDSTVDAIPTRQAVFEAAGYFARRPAPKPRSVVELVNRLNGRKETSYGTHGLHPYKGKFYPQLVGALMGAFGLERGSLLVDPFAGSGTTLVEGALRGIRTFGVDRNPLAVEMSRCKIELVGAPSGEIAQAVSIMERARSRSRRPRAELPNPDYLNKWFEAEVLEALAEIVYASGQLTSVQHRLVEITLSSILRDVSMQDPKQLRVRRRPVTDAIRNPWDLFLEKLVVNSSFVGSFSEALEVAEIGASGADATCVLGDSRQLVAALGQLGVEPGSVDALITSPPYATALPYIDTDRLSIFFMGLLSPNDRGALERQMIGNREISEKERLSYESALREDQILPEELRSFLFDLLEAVEAADVGFRRRNTPGLVYKYFADMQNTVNESYMLLKPGGMLAAVVGNNTTTIDGRVFEIETDRFLLMCGESAGFEVVESIGKRLTSPGLPSAVHSQNAMVDESILLMRRPS
jgi:hypothetical protein